MNNVDVHLHTNSSCNLQCIHCYGYIEHLNQTHVIPERLYVSIIQTLLENFNPEIHLEGGEIFLEQKIISSLDSFSLDELKNIVITTNGTIRASDKNVLSVLRKIGMLRVSIEGHTEELHNAIRHSSLVTVLDNINFYQEQGVLVCARITLNALNMNLMFSDLIPSLSERGIKSFQIYELQSVGRAEVECNDLDIKDMSLLCLFDNINHIKRDVSLKINLPKHRREEIELYAKMIEGAGAFIDDFRFCPTINISADCAVRVCAWDMTSPPLMIINTDNVDSLVDVLNSDKVIHECVHCSSFSIVRPAQT
jgi:MoaA/NifB/PqqE/SkfB family radical SAM enzyme